MGLGYGSLPCSRFDASLSGSSVSWKEIIFKKMIMQRVFFPAKRDCTKDKQAHLVKHAPLKDAPEMLVTLVDWPVLKCLVVDAIDDRDCHRGVVPVRGAWIVLVPRSRGGESSPVNWCKKRRQPVLVHLEYIIGIQIQILECKLLIFIKRKKKFLSTSQWASRNTTTTPFASFAPRVRDLV